MNDGGRQPSGRAEERHLFSLSEANALLPLFAQWLAEVQSLRQKVIGVVESKSDLSQGNGHLRPNDPRLEADLAAVSGATGRITQLIESINRTGAELKDLDLGLVDFLHRRAGRLVYLCWMFGEDQIGYWHELDGGVAGRQPL